MNEIWKRSDIITVHVPKNAETINLLNKETIKKCKRGVRIVNCARGGIINEEALAEAIKEGHVAGAAFDVFKEEPVNNSPLLTLGDKVVLTPHLGASTEEAQLNVALDVAEQIRDVLSGGLPRSAVNLPALTPEAILEVKPFMNLASNLVTIAAQLIDGKVLEIQIEAKGELSKKNTEPLKVAVLKGVLSSSVEGVNFVNAPHIAKLRGIKVIESKSTDVGDYVEELKVTLKTEKTSKAISGALVANGIPAIVQLDSYSMNATFANHMLLTHHQDKPGMVAQVSTILWQENVNISSMHVGREGPRKMSVMILNLDDPIPAKVLKKVGEIEGISEARYVTLKG